MTPVQRMPWFSTRAEFLNYSATASTRAPSGVAVSSNPISSDGRGAQPVSSVGATSRRNRSPSTRASRRSVASDGTCSPDSRRAICSCGTPRVRASCDWLRSWAAQKPIAQLATVRTAAVRSLSIAARTEPPIVALVCARETLRRRSQNGCGPLLKSSFGRLHGTSVWGLPPSFASRRRG